MANMKKAGISGVINRVGSLQTLFFTNQSGVRSFSEALQADTEKYAEYFRNSLDNGIYLAPSQFEAMFISQAHSDEDIDNCLAASLTAMEKINLIIENS